MQFADICGWVGAILCLLAYWIVSMGFLEARTIDVQFINFIGAVCLGFSAYKKTLWAVVALNLFWAGIAVYTIIQIY